jgi:hypothetical protein
MPGSPHIRIPTETLTWLAPAAPDGAAAGAVRQALDDYCELLDRGRRRLRALLSAEEQVLLQQVALGTWLDTVTAFHFAQDVEDALSFGEVSLGSGQADMALLDKLRGLDDGARLALADALRRRRPAGKLLEE